VTPKDSILELLRRRGVRGGLGRIFEFFGPGVASIDVTGRTTICNMIAELGATTGVFSSDETTRERLDEQQRRTASASRSSWTLWSLLSRNPTRPATWSR